MSENNRWIDYITTVIFILNFKEIEGKDFRRSCLIGISGKAS